MKNFIKALFKDLVDQAYTLLGMTVAWLVLEGSAKELTGNLILITTAIWVITFPIFRYEKPEDPDKE
jgi:Na+-transporting NADH:ubiquinone oxidoreductase subunit NqrD